jgi:hypothetical protein
MLDVLLHHLPSVIHTSIHLREILGPAASVRVCPDCVCSVGAAAALEPIQALTSALQFAQSQCTVTSTSTTSITALPSASSWSYSLVFRLGFTAGVLCCLVSLLALRFCARLLSSAQRSPEPAGAQVVRPILQAGLTQGEPATPATLRQLGLLK